VYPRQIAAKSPRWFLVCLFVGHLLGAVPANAQAVPTPSSSCLQVGTTRCLQSDLRLVDAIQSLQATDVGPDLLRNAADRRVQLRVGRLDRGLEGQYSPRTRTIVVDRRVARRAVQVRALVLAHELQHATERPSDDESAEACFASEEAAFRVEAHVWPQLWGGQLPPDVDAYYKDANDLVRQLATDPEGFASDIREMYQDDCGDDEGEDEDE
jgi:hypothetical protein